MAELDTNMDKIDLMDWDDPKLATYPAGSSFGPRRGGDFEFVWMLQGHAQVRFDEVPIDAPVGTLLLRRPGMTDFYQWDSERPTVHGYIHFSLKSPGGNWPLSRRLPDKSLLRSLVEALQNLIGLDEALKMVLLPPLLKSLLLAYEHGALPAQAGSQIPQALQAAVRAMDLQVFERACAPLALPDLAKACGVGPEHLCRLFTKHLGQGPMSYYLGRRLEQAATLLSRSNLSIKEVAVASGFEDPFHFSKAFRKRYGRSPLAFRRSP